MDFTCSQITVEFKRLWFKSDTPHMPTETISLSDAAVRSCGNKLELEELIFDALNLRLREDDRYKRVSKKESIRAIRYSYTPSFEEALAKLEPAEVADDTAISTDSPEHPRMSFASADDGTSVDDETAEPVTYKMTIKTVGGFDYTYVQHGVNCGDSYEESAKVEVEFLAGESFTKAENRFLKALEQFVQEKELVHLKPAAGIQCIDHPMPQTVPALTEENLHTWSAAAVAAAQQTGIEA